MARVFISYRRINPDQRIASAIRDRLTREKHDVFLDTAELRAGDRWEERLREEVRKAEYFVPLVSSAYLASDAILEYELLPAIELDRARAKSTMLQVRVEYGGNPPDYLQKVQYVEYREPQDLGRVLDSIASRLPAPIPLILGARSFEKTHAGVFHELGREEDAANLIAVIDANTQPHVLLHGVSGAGKTSVLRAGVCPRLKGAVEILELNDDVTPHDLRRAATPGAILVLDQFEQTLIALARDASRHEAFANSFDALTKDGTRIVFAIRDEYRTAFEQMLPRVAGACTPFALLPFTPTQAVDVFAKLLASGGVSHDAESLPLVCEAVAEGVPRTVLPAILQVIAQHCQMHEIRLSAAAWVRLAQKEQSVFEEHVRDAVIGALPRTVPRLDATTTLLALTSGDVKSTPKSLEEITTERSVNRAHAEKVLAVAAGAAKVANVTFDGDDASPRYRLTHDLFVAPVRRLHDLATRRRERWRQTAYAAVFALLAVIASALWWRASRATFESERLAAASDYVRALDEIENGRPDVSALYAARAFATAPPKDEQRATYALSALHTSVGLGVPVVISSPGYDDIRFLESGHVVVTGENDDAWIYDAMGARFHVPPLRETRVVAVSSNSAWIARYGYGPNSSSWIESVREGTRVVWQAPWTAGLRFNSDASLLVSRGSPIHVWSRETGQPLHGGITSPPDTAVDVTLEAGREMAAIARPESIELFDLRTGRVIQEIPESGVSSVRFSGDGQLVATGSSNPPRLRMRDVSGGTFIAEAPVYARTRIDIMDVSRDGSRVLALLDSDPVLWDHARRTVEQIPVREPYSLHFLGGGLVASISRNPRTLRTWSTNPIRQSGAPLRIPNDVREHRFFDSKLVAGWADGRVMRWDLARPLPIIGEASETWRLSMPSRDRSRILLWGTDPRLQSTTFEVVNVGTGRIENAVTVPHINDDARLLHNRFIVLWRTEGPTGVGEQDAKTMIAVCDLHTKKTTALLEIELQIGSVAASRDGSRVRLLGMRKYGDAPGNPMLLQEIDVATGRISSSRDMSAWSPAVEFIDDEGQSISVVTTRLNGVTISLLDHLADSHEPLQLTFDGAGIINAEVLEALWRGAAIEFEDAQTVTARRDGEAAFRLRAHSDGISITAEANDRPVILPPANEFRDAVFARDGRYVVLFSPSVVQVWDLWSGLPATPSTEFANTIRSVQLIENDRAIAVATRGDGLVRKLELGRGGSADPCIEDLAQAATAKRVTARGVTLISPADHAAALARLRKQNIPMIRSWLSQ